MTAIRIDQFSPSISVGDGVSNSMLFIRSLLRELGYQSDIYCYTIPTELEKDIKPAPSFRDAGCSLLLFHHAFGSPHGAWLKARQCPKALVYHNITPPEFFPHGSPGRRDALLGLQQLMMWRDEFVHAIAVSPLNQTALQEAGYPRSQVIPLLVDLDKLSSTTAKPAFMQQYPANSRFYLSVGRLATNKRQHLLIEAFHHLMHMQPLAQEQHTPQRLILVGAATSRLYTEGLKLFIKELGLEDQILLAGKCSDEELRWLYSHAEQYWCASAHEGFCMPLLEANAASLPVIAMARSNIPNTLGEAGLLLDSDNPIDFASTAHILNNDAALRQTLIEAGSRNLARYAHQNLKNELVAWLKELGINAPRQ